MRLHTEWDKVWNKSAVFSFIATLCGFFVLYLSVGASAGNLLIFEVIAGAFFVLGLVTGLFSLLVEARKGAWLRWLAIGFAALLVVNMVRGKTRKFGLDAPPARRLSRSTSLARMMQMGSPLHTPVGPGHL